MDTGKRGLKSQKKNWGTGHEPGRGGLCISLSQQLSTNNKFKRQHIDNPQQTINSKNAKLLAAGEDRET